MRTKLDSHIIIVGGLALVLMLTIALIMIALSRMAILHQHIELVVNQYNVKADLINAMSRSVQDRGNLVMSMMAMTDPFAQDEAYMEMNDVATDFAVARIAFGKMPLTIKEQVIYDQHGKLAEQARYYLETAIEHLIAGDAALAKRLLLEYGLPRQNQVREILTQLHELQREAVDKALNQAEKSYRRSELWIIVLGIGVMLLSIAIGWFMVCYISKQSAILKQANDTLEDRVKERTTELLLAHDEALKSNQAKSQFLSKMSHELRTPLNAIIGYSEMLKDDCTNVAGGEIFESDLLRITSSGKHLLALINDILDLAKIEANKMELHFDNVIIEGLINDVIDMAKPLADNHANEIKVVNHANIKMLMSDPIRIRQILFNLINNACKFTDNGKITLTVEDDETWLYFSVQDTGIGMDATQLQTLFQEFVQGDHNRGGTGLGLTISQRFCKMLGGNIEVKSQLQKGTLFTVKIPKKEILLNEST